jgi:hypothetical protein
MEEDAMSDLPKSMKQVAVLCVAPRSVYKTILGVDAYDRRNYRRRNYRYGLRAPIVNRDGVLDQLQLAHEYREVLVQIELDRRAVVDQAMRKLCPGLIEIEESIKTLSTQIEDLVAQRKRSNKEARRRMEDDESTKRLAELKRKRKDGAAARKSIRAKGFGEFCAALSLIDEQAAARVRQARAQCEVYWGSYLLVEQAASAFRSGPPPVHRGYRGEGRIAVQIQGGMAWEDAVSGRDTRLRIVHMPQCEQRLSKKGVLLPAPLKRRRALQYELHLRIGSDGRNPIWASWPLILHRPIPDGAQIMWAIVQRRIVAGKERWSLVLALRMLTVPERQKQNADLPFAGFDVGYRARPSGRLRVGYLADSTGQHGEFALEAGFVAQWKKVEDLQSIRDRLHNDIRTILKVWLYADRPDWLREATETIALWRRPSRLDCLVRMWSERRFAGDEGIFAELAAWRKKERHLWQYQEHLRDQILARRLDLYRNWAAELKHRYRTIGIEALDLRELQGVNRPAAEAEEDEPAAAIRRAARIAALSELIRCLRETGIAIELPPEDTTRICSWCGTPNGGWDQAAELVHTCVNPKCAKGSWDQDHNAARNLLASTKKALESRASLAGSAGQGDASNNGAARKPSRSERFAAARKKRAEAKRGKELG